MKIKIKQTNPNSIIPTYATDGSGCFDLYAPKDFQATDVLLGEPVNINTGIAFEIPHGHVMLAFSRSGHGFKNNTRLANCVGVIDADFRGPVGIRLTRDTTLQDYIQPLIVDAGDRIAQAMVIPVSRVEFELVDELSETSRGDGGFGSTGA